MQDSMRAIVMVAGMGLAMVALAQTRPAEEGAGLPGGTASAGAGAGAGEEKRGEVTYSASAGAAQQFSTDLDEGGDFSLTRYGVGVGVQYPLQGTGWTGDHWRFGIEHSLLYERDEYNSDVLPWDSVNALSYALRVSDQLDKDWTVFGGPMVGVSAAEGANWGDALRYGAIGGAAYRASQDLTLGLGVAVFEDVGDEVSVFPTLLVDAKLGENLRIRNARPQPGFRGTGGVELVCTAVEDWEFGVGGAYDSRRFRLDTIDGRDDLVGQNRAIPVFVRVGYRPADEWTVSAMAGVLFAGELRIEDDAGHKIASSDYDPAPFVGLGVSWRK